MKFAKNLLTVILAVSSFVGTAIADEKKNLNNQCDSDNREECFKQGDISRGKAKSLYKQACDHEYWPACNALGELESFGDSVEAKRLFELACDHEYSQACKNNIYFTKSSNKEAKIKAQVDSLADKLISTEVNLTNIQTPTANINPLPNPTEGMKRQEKADDNPITDTTQLPQDSNNNYSVSQSDLDSALADLPEFRSVPYFRNGNCIGVRLYAIRKDSLYEKFGLKNGDIVKTVNDTKIVNPTQLLKLFEQLQHEKQLHVVIERTDITGNKDKTLYISVSP